MHPGNDPILPLPEDVAKQLRSSIAVPSLNSAIVGLFKNSLDAGAQRIDVEVDHCRGACTVEDDGLGILPSEFSVQGGLAKQHHTSKPRGRCRLHGQNGTFLSSIASLSILTITSHHSSCRCHATLVLHHSRPAARLIPAPSYHEIRCREHGTRVSIQDLFGNMPVRVKQRALETQNGRESERLIGTLRKELVGLLLAWGKPVDVSVRTSNGVRKLYLRGNETLDKSPYINMDSRSTCGVDLIRATLSQAGYVDPAGWSHWVKVSARTPLITVQGAISINPAPSKLVQFIALGLHAVDASVSGSILYDDVNGLFAASNFGTQEDMLDVEESDSTKPDRRRRRDEFSRKQLKGGGKGIDRWPMFFIQVDLHDGSPSSFNRATDVLDKQNALLVITKALTAIVTGFLEDNHFQHRKRRAQNPDQEGMAISSKISLASSSSTPNVLRKQKPMIGPLGCEVKIPTSTGYGVRSLTDESSSWSRIKSSSRNILQELTPQKTASNPPDQSCISKTAGQEPRMAIPLRSPARDQEVLCLSRAGYVPSAEDAPENVTVIGPNGRESFLKTAASDAKNVDCKTMAEETISWTKPASRDTVLVNARTGLVVGQPPARLKSDPHSSPSLGRPPREVHPSNSTLTNSRSSTQFTPPKEGSWVGGFLENWNNPIFKPTESAIPKTSFNGFDVEAAAILQGRRHCCSFLDVQKAFAEASSSSFTRLSKSGLQTASVISQVERKFVLISMKAMPSERTVSATAPEKVQELLVLVDQHAADERVRVEGLLAQLCSPMSQMGMADSTVTLPQFESAIITTTLDKSIILDIPAQEQRLFAAHRGHFADWGILYDFAPKMQSSSISASSSCRLLIKTLPGAIAERCRLEPKVLIELLRNQVWKREESGHRGRSTAESQERNDLSTVANGWLSRMRDCPQGIIDMINSRSCRSAIMFNDELTIKECQSLIQRLARCAFPFQCAHGRPSMIPLVDSAANPLDHTAGHTAFGSMLNTAAEASGETCFSQAWRQWKK